MQPVDVDPAILETVEVQRRHLINAVGRESYEAYQRMVDSFDGTGRLERADPNEDPHPDLDLQRPWLPKWPKLRAQPFHDITTFPWTAPLIAATDTIRAELDAVLSRGSGFQRGIYDSFEGDTWRVFYFYVDGKRIDENCALCPKTIELVEQFPLNGAHVAFSRLRPAGRLTEHVGPSNTSLTCHLGLLNADRTVIQAGREKESYGNGKCLIFDDTFVHNVHNRSREARYTLMFTIWHPDLTEAERQALRDAFEDYANRSPKPMVESPN